MKSKRKPVTAAELMARLRSDPGWVRENAEREARHQAEAEKRQKAMAPEEAPLLAELAKAGVKVRSRLDQRLGLHPEPAPVTDITDLMNTRDSYPEAIPILVKYLRFVQHPVMIDIIARSLTVKEARETAAPRLILEKLKQSNPYPPAPTGDAYDAYWNIECENATWALANALTFLGEADMVEEIKALIADPAFARSHERLEKALARCERLAKRKKK